MSYLLQLLLSTFYGTELESRDIKDLLQDYLKLLDTSCGPRFSLLRN